MMSASIWRPSSMELGFSNFKKFNFGLRKISKKYQSVVYYLF
jgi:hypothetical protein